MCAATRVFLHRTRAAAATGVNHDDKDEPSRAAFVIAIGTPLSKSATRILLLGSGELGKEVSIAAQRLGVEVAAVDRYANAPAHSLAQRAHVIDMTDPQALRALIEKERPDIIVPEIEAIATEVLVEIESQGLAMVVPSARAVQLTMNREGIRRLAAEELKLPTSPYAFASSYVELEAAANSGIGSADNGNEPVRVGHPAEDRALRLDHLQADALEFGEVRSDAI